MFWSQVISLQMQPSPFNRWYYATQDCIWYKNTVLCTDHTHEYGCALNAVLLHDKNTMVIILQIHKNINIYVL